MTGWRDRPLAELLAAFRLDGIPERPFPADGWSGSTFSTLERDGERFVVKRVSPERDWIVRATHDDEIREAWLAGVGLRSQDWLPGAAGRVTVPYLGAAIDEDGSAVILMPDLSTELVAWERPTHEPALGPEATDRLLDRIAFLHSLPWSEVLMAQRERAGAPAPPWCPLPERLTLLTRRSAVAYAAAGNPVGEIFLRGWDGFDRHATPAARDLLGRLGDDPEPLVRALGQLPSVGLHGDIKLANVALFDDGGVAFIDWQMTLRGAGRGRARLVHRDEQRRAALPAGGHPAPLPRVARPGRRRGAIRRAAARSRRPRWQLGGATGPGRDRRAAPARLAEGPRHRRRGDPGLRASPLPTTSPGGALARSRRPSGGSRPSRSRVRPERRGRGAGR